MCQQKLVDIDKLTLLKDSAFQDLKLESIFS